MKRLLILALATWCGWQIHAQGTFIFSNRLLSLGLNQPVISTLHPRGIEGPTFVAAVFLNGTQLGLPAPFRTGTGAGYWDAGADNLRVVRGKFAGDTVTGFSVTVWDSRYGDTYERSRNAGGLAGESRRFSIVLGGPKADPLLPPDLPGAMLKFTNFAIGLPEPSVLVLGTLGAVAMLASRRQQPKSIRRQSERNL